MSNFALPAVPELHTQYRTLLHRRLTRKTPVQPAQLGLMLAVSSILGVLVGTYAIPDLVSKLNLGWYATLRYSAFAHVCLFPLIALTGCLAKWENGLGPCTIAIIGLVLLCYEFGEMGYT